MRNYGQSMVEMCRATEPELWQTRLEEYLNKVSAISSASG